MHAHSQLLQRSHVPNLGWNYGERILIYGEPAAQHQLRDLWRDRHQLALEHAPVGVHEVIVLC